MPTSAPRLSAALFVIPLDPRFLVYAPLRRAPFATGAATVNRIADLRDGPTFVGVLRRLQIADAPPSFRP